MDCIILVYKGDQLVQFSFQGVVAVHCTVLGNQFELITNKQQLIALLYWHFP